MVDTNTHRMLFFRLLVGWLDGAIDIQKERLPLYGYICDACVCVSVSESASVTVSVYVWCLWLNEGAVCVCICIWTCICQTNRDQLRTHRCKTWTRAHTHISACIQISMYLNKYTHRRGPRPSNVALIHLPRVNFSHAWNQTHVHTHNIYNYSIHIGYIYVIARNEYVHRLRRLCHCMWVCDCGWMSKLNIHIQCGVYACIILQFLYTIFAAAAAAAALLSLPFQSALRYIISQLNHTHSHTQFFIFISFHIFFIVFHYFCFGFILDFHIRLSFCTLPQSISVVYVCSA